MSIYEYKTVCRNYGKISIGKAKNKFGKFIKIENQCNLHMYRRNKMGSNSILLQQASNKQELGKYSHSEKIKNNYTFLKLHQQTI